MRLLEAYRGGFQGRPGWWLRLEYSEDGVERLTQTIPASQRTWDAESGRWWISLEAEDLALRVVPSLEAYQKQGSLL